MDTEVIPPGDDQEKWKLATKVCRAKSRAELQALVDLVTGHPTRAYATDAQKKEGKSRYQNYAGPRARFKIIGGVRARARAHLSAPAQVICSGAKGCQDQILRLTLAMRASVAK
jgi:hypothetical protein